MSKTLNKLSASNSLNESTNERMPAAASLEVLQSFLSGFFFRLFCSLLSRGTMNTLPSSVCSTEYIAGSYCCPVSLCRRRNNSDSSELSFCFNDVERRSSVDFSCISLSRSRRNSNNCTRHAVTHTHNGVNLYSTSSTGVLVWPK